MPRGKLIASEATPAARQHTGPCSDCPWRRDAVAGWLGGSTPDTYRAAAHSDEAIYCHVHIGAQCAGASVYRANVCKMSRDPDVLRLPADRVKVFARPDEFMAHHGDPATQLRELGRGRRRRR